LERATDCSQAAPLPRRAVVADDRSRGGVTTPLLLLRHHPASRWWGIVKSRVLNPQ